MELNFDRFAWQKRFRGTNGAYQLYWNTGTIWKTKEQVILWILHGFDGLTSLQRYREAPVSTVFLWMLGRSSVEILGASDLKTCSFKEDVVF